MAEELPKLFAEYLEGVAVRDGLLSGRNPAGRWFLLYSTGNRVFLVVGEADYEAAKALIKAAAQK